jgi:SAM-dependent methyltransferase
VGFTPLARSGTIALVGARYEAWHEERDRASEEHLPTAPWHLSTLRHLPDLRGKRVLEIGCGRGVFAKVLAERGADLVAADFSETAVSYAETRLQGWDAETLVADIQAIPFPDQSFDVVVSQETVEHVRDPRRALAELVRVMRPGGLLIVTGPNYLNLIGLYRIAMRAFGRRFTEIGQPINQPLLLPAQVRRLRRLGCRIEAVEGQGVPIPVPRYRTVYFPARPQRIMRWLALNTLIAARRP